MLKKTCLLFSPLTTLSAFLLGTVFFFTPGSAFSQSEEEGLEALLFEDIPMVESSSKKLEKISSAPSNITVISAERIKAMGLRTIRDVLSIVPGFFMGYDRDEWVPTARGVTSDNSLQYMLLIDGQDISIATSFGVSGAYEMPNDLSNVKQVEVIRGPGSVIWGGSSLGGVVNIVTKKASDLKNNHQVDFTLGTDSTQKFDFITGNTLSPDASYVFSGAYFSSDGDDIETDASVNLPQFFQNYGTNRDPFGRFVTALDRIDPSYRLHLKGQMGNFDFSAYSFQNKVYNRQFEIDMGRDAWLKRRVHFLEGKWKKEMEEGQYLRSKISAGKTEQEYFIQDAIPLILGKANPTFFTQVDDFLTLALDGKNNLGSEKISLEWGLELIRRDLFTSLISPASLNTNLSPVTGNISGREEDLTAGLYSVLLLKPADALTFLLGGRLENNSDRGKDALITTPRLGAIWDLSETNTFKLLYNSGYRRPTPERDAFKAETIEQLELIWMKKFEKSQLTVTCYTQELSDLLFLTQGGLTSGQAQVFVSGGSEKATGVEIEANTTLGERLTLWAALSLGNAEAKDFPAGTPVDVQRIMPNGDKLGYLDQSLAVGATAHLTQSFFISPTLRYQGPMDVRLRAATGSLANAVYDEIPSVLYVDCNIGFEPEGKNYAFYVYGNNLTDEKEPMPHAIRNGTRETYGLYVEGKVSAFF